MGSVVRKITRPVKKAVKSVAKVAKSPVGQIALSIAVPQLSFMRGIGAGLSPFAAGALRSGITSGIISGLSGRGLDPRSLLTSAVIGGGLSRFGAGRAAQLGESNLVDPRFQGTVQSTDLSKQLIDAVQPENIVPTGPIDRLTGEIAGEISPTGIQQIGRQTIDQSGGRNLFAELFDTSAMAGERSTTSLPLFDPNEPIAGAVDVSEFIPQEFDFPGGAVDVESIIPDPKQAVREVTNKGDTIFQIKDNIRPIFERIKAGEIKSALDLTADVAKTNKLDLALIGLSVAPLFAGQKLEQEEGESNIDFEKRRENVRGYLRQYGSKFYSGDELDDFINRSLVAKGGRVGLANGSEDKSGIMMASAPDAMDSLNDLAQMLFGKNLDQLTNDERDALDDYNQGLAKGGMPTGIMRTNAAGIKERDYRDEGGFVPVGIKEKADDVPAMLSKNEFVMTADAVRGAGDGSIEKGAQKMYDTMKKLEDKVA